VDAAFRLAEAAADRVQGPIERVAADAAAREVGRVSIVV
jgi:hypothetical protein